MNNLVNAFMEYSLAKHSQGFAERLNSNEHKAKSLELTAKASLCLTDEIHKLKISQHEKDILMDRIKSHGQLEYDIATREKEYSRLRFSLDKTINLLCLYKGRGENIEQYTDY